VYGFGSIFRSYSYSDIDIAVVFSPRCAETLPPYTIFLRLITEFGKVLGVRFDVTPLTDREFQQKPLLESDSLVLLYLRERTEA
jgi:predicted nucleotidyltransferase